MTKRVLFFLLLISLLYSSTPVLASDALSTNYLISENSQNDQMYGYNKNYTLTQWRSLSQAERNKELQIPEEIFKSLNTKELLLECLNHPSIAAFGAFTDPKKPSEGFNHLLSTFMAFDHLIQRSDLIEAIIELYTQQEMLSTNKDYNIIFINDLINVPEITQLLSNDQINLVSLHSTLIDHTEENNELYRIAFRYDTIFRIDKVYKRVTEVYNIDVTPPEIFNRYLQIIKEIEAIEKQELLRQKENQRATTRNYYPTRWGHSSMLTYPTSHYPPINSSKASSLNAYYANKFPSDVRLTEPSEYFNCHSYALFSYDGTCELYVIGSTAAAILNTNDNNYFNKTYFPSTSFPLNYTLVR